MPRQPEDRKRHSWKQQKSHNIRIDGTENVKLSNLEKDRAMPPSSDYENITTVSNNVEPGKNKQPSPSSESNEQNDQNEETHRNYVDKKTFHQFIQTMMEIKVA